MENGNKSMSFEEFVANTLKYDYTSTSKSSPLATVNPTPPVSFETSFATLNPPPSNDSKGSIKPKRIRTAFTGKQIIEMQSEFHNNMYLCPTRRSEIADHLGLTEKQIKIWFQNRRRKTKRDAKLASKSNNNTCLSVTKDSNNCVTEQIKNHTLPPQQHLASSSASHLHQGNQNVTVSDGYTFTNCQPSTFHSAPIGMENVYSSSVVTRSNVVKVTQETANQHHSSYQQTVSFSASHCHQENQNYTTFDGNVHPPPIAMEYLTPFPVPNNVPAVYDINSMPCFDNTIAVVDFHFSEQGSTSSGVTVNMTSNSPTTSASYATNNTAGYLPNSRNNPTTSSTTSLPHVDFDIDYNFFENL